MQDAGLEYAAASSGSWMTMQTPLAPCRVTTVRHPSRYQRELSRRRTASWKAC